MLTDARLRSLLPSQDGKPRRKWDRDGLYIEVRPSGAKVWRYKFRIGGKEGVEALGAYPEVTLAAARAHLLESRRLVAAGISPLAHRRAERLAGVTFKAVAEEWIAEHGAGWAANTRALTEARLATYAYPVIGAMPIRDVRRPDVLRVIAPLTKARKLTTAHRVVGRIRAVVRYAMQTERADADPTDGLKGAVPVGKTTHRAAILDPVEVGALLRAIDAYQGGPQVRTALRLLPLVFTRPGELCGAEWAEIDVARAEWTLPARKMKMRRDHIVPLAPAALALLDEIRPITGTGRFVFPNARDATRPMSENALIVAMKAIGYGGARATPHGFRSTARSLIHERLKVGGPIIEKQLAHRAAGALGAAYDRAEYLADRHKMMARWADYLDNLKATNVVQFMSPRRG